MPKVEPKIIQRELEQGTVWPVYWLYGSEKMKARELFRRIRSTVLGEGENASTASLLGMAEETFDGTETDAGTILDAAQSQSLGGGVRLIVVREAHALKEPEILADLMTKPGKRDEMSSVCVFFSKDLDARKKFSKLLVDKAAVVPCEEVPESDREAWIQYLSKRKGLSLPAAMVAQLCILDPWSLDIMEMELEKCSLAEDQSADVILGGGFGGLGGSETFMQAFFTRNLKGALESAETFANRPDESLPLLGLLAWNVRHLALLIAERDSGTRTVKINSFVAEKLSRWIRHWELREILAVQDALSEIDFSLKQTPLLPIGVWNTLVTRFCR